MANRNREIKISNVDDLFSTQELRDVSTNTKVMRIDIEKIKDFKDHPFKVETDKNMLELVKSIEDHGVLVPAIVRPASDGKYEMVSGHRRKLACAMADIERMPCIVKDLSNDEATIIMVDSNIQREGLLPSEKAFAYKMKLEAMKRQAGRKKNYSPVENNLNETTSSGQMAVEVGESKATIFRYIRLTNLNKSLLDMVDANLIAIRPAVELSYLTEDEQDILLDKIKLNDATPSLAQAIQLKQYSQAAKFDEAIAGAIMSEYKPNQKERISLKKDNIKKFFPRSYSDQQMQETIVHLLEEWSKKRNKKIER